MLELDVPALFNLYDSVVMMSVEPDDLLSNGFSMQAVFYPVVFGKVFRIPEEQLILEIKEAINGCNYYM